MKNMTKRTLSLMLCLMMVVSLFAGTLTSASAADVNFSVSPTTAVINGTGSAEFTAGTALDALIDQIGTGKDIDLSDLVSQLKDQGFDLDQITGLLDGAGFNWEDIVGSLTDGGFDISDIADKLKDAIGNGDINLEDLLGDFSDSASLKDLADALNGAGLDSDLLDKVLDVFKGGEEGDSSIIDVIGGLIGGIGGKNGEGAKPEAEESEPVEAEEPAEDSVTSVVADKLKESLKEKYGSLFTAEKEQEFDELFGKIEDASGALDLGTAVDGIADIMGSEDFDAAKTVDAIMDATNGSADYSELVKALQDSTGSDLTMDEMSKAFSDALGSDLDLNKLADALSENMGTEFKAEDFLNALGEGMDKQALVDSVVSALGSDSSISAEDLEKALDEALKDQGGFDAAKLAETMGEDFDANAFLESVAAQLTDAENVDANAVSDAIDKALAEQGEQSTLNDLAAALKDTMGEDLDVQKLVDALSGAASEDGEAPDLSSIVEAVTGALGDDMTADQLTELVKGLLDTQGEDTNVTDILSALSDKLPEDISTSDLLSSLSEALGDEEFAANLQDIAKQILGEDGDLTGLVQALKDFDLSTNDISDLLFSGALTYEWWCRDGKTSTAVASLKDKNTYAGADTRTLTVTRDAAPDAEETYTYFCKITVGENSYDTGDAVLTIKPLKSEEPTPTDPGTSPAPVTAPTLDNEKHTSYINGYPDGTFGPAKQITRAEAAAILYRLMTPESQSAYRTTANTFSDVKAGDWFNEAVSSLARASVINGYPDGTFRPQSPISRAEMATLLTKLTVKDTSLVKEGEAKNFPDTTGHWAAGYIRTASAKGWIAGYEDGTFRPENKITRAEAVTMVNRMLGRNPSVLTSTTGMRTFPDNADTSAWYYIQIQEAANGHTYSRTEKGVEYWTGVVN